MSEKRFVVLGDKAEMDHGFEEGTIVKLVRDDGSDIKGYQPVDDDKGPLSWFLMYIHDGDVKLIEEA